MVSQTLSRNRLIASCVAIYLIAQASFLIYLQFPTQVNFDEFHYIPAARALLEGRYDVNLEHPPLGKLLIAAGMRVAGDHPFGWRLAATVAGAWTAVAIFLLAYLLFRKTRAALLTLILAYASNFLFVQARIALLDTFMTAALVWSAVFFLKEKWKSAGVFLGLAIACKWSALAAIPLWIGLRLLKECSWKVIGQAALEFVVIPIGVYFSAFIPLMIFTDYPRDFFHLLRAQQQMWAGISHEADVHRYESKWYQWLIPTKAIWFRFDTEGESQQWVRGSFLVGNPLVMTPGLYAIAVCAWDGFKNAKSSPRFIACFYLMFTLCWAFSTRRINFYYYYYPSALMLCCALTYLWFERPKWARLIWPCVLFYGGRILFPEIFPSEDSAFLILIAASGITGAAWMRMRRKKPVIPALSWLYAGVCMAGFIYFLPLLMAWKIPTEAFRQWMWFSSWI